MAEPSQHPEVQGSPILPRKKFKKATTAMPSGALTVESTIFHLKNEASHIKSSGIAQFICEGDAQVKEELKPLLLTYLSTKTDTTFQDLSGDEHATFNEAIYRKFYEEHEHFFNHSTAGVAQANLGAENALNLHCNLVNALTVGLPGKDGVAKVSLDKSSGGDPQESKAKMEGGFSTAYGLVAATKYKQEMQKRCVFGFAKAAKFGTECTAAAGNLVVRVNTMILGMFPGYAASSEGAHVLFNWCDHSLFTYHQDEKSDVTVIVNLSPSKSSFHIAGKDEAETYSQPGDAFVLPSKAYHRSGEAERRTVKVAFFFKLTKKATVDLTDDKPEGEAPAQKVEEVVKEEKKEAESSS